MYAAKIDGKGKGGHIVYQPSLYDRLAPSTDSEQALARAVA